MSGFCPPPFGTSLSTWRGGLVKASSRRHNGWKHGPLRTRFESCCVPASWTAPECPPFTPVSDLCPQASEASTPACTAVRPGLVSRSVGESVTPASPAASRTPPAGPSRQPQAQCGVGCDAAAAEHEIVQPWTRNLDGLGQSVRAALHWREEFHHAGSHRDAPAAAAAPTPRLRNQPLLGPSPQW